WWGGVGGGWWGDGVGRRGGLRYRLLCAGRLFLKSRLHLAGQLFRNFNFRPRSLRRFHGGRNRRRGFFDSRGGCFSGASLDFRLGFLACLRNDLDRENGV